MGFFPCWVKGLWPMIQVDPYLEGHMLSVTRWIIVPSCWSKGLDQAEWRRDAIYRALIQMIHVFGAKAQIFLCRRRSCSGGWSLHTRLFFFFLWIITYYYYYLAFRRHSAMIQPHGSRWINLDHKTYFSTRNYDPNVTDNICPFNHGSSWITGFFPCWVKGLWPMIQLDPCLRGHMLSYHTAALGIMIQLY